MLRQFDRSRHRGAWLALCAAVLVTGAVSGADAGESGITVSGTNPYFVLADTEDTAYLGVRLEEETEHAEGGARITDVIDGSPAEEAGMRDDDIIVKFDGQTIRGPAGLTKRIRAREPEDRVEVVVIRDGESRALEVELGDREGLWGGISTPLELGAATLWSWGGRPTLGVQLVETTPELRGHLGGDDDSGVLVSKILRGTPADHSGIEVGDLILAVDGERVKNAGELRRALRGKDGETIEVELVREGSSKRLEVVLPEQEQDVPTGPRALLHTPEGGATEARRQWAEARQLAVRAQHEFQRIQREQVRDVQREARKQYSETRRLIRDAERKHRAISRRPASTLL